MIAKETKAVMAIAWVLAVFLVSAVMESFITVWVFRRYGGCPFNKKELTSERRLGYGEEPLRVDHGASGTIQSIRAG